MIKERTAHCWDWLHNEIRWQRTCLLTFAFVPFIKEKDLTKNDWMDIGKGGEKLKMEQEIVTVYPSPLGATADSENIRKLS